MLAMDNDPHQAENALALEKAAPGGRLHASAEEGITFGAIAQAIGTGLGVPVQSFQG